MLSVNQVFQASTCCDFLHGPPCSMISVCLEFHHGPVFFEAKSTVVGPVMRILRRDISPWVMWVCLKLGYLNPRSWRFNVECDDRQLLELILPHLQTNTFDWLSVWLPPSHSSPVMAGQTVLYTLQLQNCWIYMLS